MIVEKGLPALGWRRVQGSYDSGDGAFRDGDAQHLQFAMDPRCAPKRIGSRHPLDQLANLDGRRVPPRQVGRTPAGYANRTTIGEGAIQNIRSKAVRTGRFRFRWRAASWRRSARVLNSNGLVTAHQRSHESIDTQHKDGMSSDSSARSGSTSTGYERTE
jgi:hypothetical protein